MRFDKKMMFLGYKASTFTGRDGRVGTFYPVSFFDLDERDTITINAAVTNNPDLLPSLDKAVQLAAKSFGVSCLATVEFQQDRQTGGWKPRLVGLSPVE